MCDLMTNNDSDSTIVQTLGEVFTVEQGLQDTLIKIKKLGYVYNVHKL